MGNKKKIDAAQVLSAFGAKPQPPMDTTTTQATQDKMATLSTIATQSTTKDTQQTYRHIAINNDIWEKVKALQGQTGAPLNHIINRALAKYIQDIEAEHGTITTNKLKLI